MIWTIEHIEALNFVKIDCEGSFTLGEIIQMTDDIVALPHWSPGIDLFFNCQKMDFSKTDMDILREASNNHQRHDKLIGHCKVALLMKSPRDFGLGRQYEMLTEGKASAQIRIFLDEAKALEWILADKTMTAEN